MSNATTVCQRCQRPLRPGPIPGSKARMLRRSQRTEGLCINCAVHDWLRNTYPCNMLLDEGGPQVLLFPDIQAQFSEIMRHSLADAVKGEIDWPRIVDQWDLPWPTPVARSATNPWDGRERPPSRQRPTRVAPSLHDVPLTITSFEQLNTLEAGLGDDLRAALRGACAKGETKSA